MKRVCVVGAGPSGLTATKSLIHEGLQVDCYEKSPHIGGHWVIDNPTGCSSAYRSLHTNTTKRMSRFSDFEMPAEWPEFPSFGRVREWLESYVDKFAFRENIRLSTEVMRAVPQAKGGWTLTLKSPDGVTYEKDYDALVVASGSYWDPKMPEWPGSFDGEILHSQDYRDPQTPLQTNGKRVIVVGIGNTGCELACELSGAQAASVELSARSGSWIVPKTVDGVPIANSTPLTHPTDPVPDELVQLPEEHRDAALMTKAIAAFKGRYAGRMKQLEAQGLPSAPDHPFLKRPTISQNLLECLEKGAMVAKPQIIRLDSDGIIYEGGERAEADIILCATGYHLSYPFLDQDVADTSDDDLDLFCGIVPSDRDDLFFIGVSRPFGAFWPIAEAQAQFAGAFLSGRYQLPSKDERERRASPMLNRVAITPGLYGLALREELERGAIRHNS